MECELSAGRAEAVCDVAEHEGVVVVDEVRGGFVELIEPPLSLGIQFLREGGTLLYQGRWNLRLPKPHTCRQDDQNSTAELVAGLVRDAYPLVPRFQTWGDEETDEERGCSGEQDCADR